MLLDQVFGHESQVIGDLLLILALVQLRNRMVDVFEAVLVKGEVSLLAADVVDGDFVGLRSVVALLLVLCHPVWLGKVGDDVPVLNWLPVVELSADVSFGVGDSHSEDVILNASNRCCGRKCF